MALHKLDALALDKVLIGAGFPKDDLPTTTSPTGLYRRRTAWAKAMAESGGFYDIIGGPNPNLPVTSSAEVFDVIRNITNTVSITQ